jgi:DNA-binding NarL/FixJ family response regulator
LAGKLSLAEVARTWRRIRDLLQELVYADLRKRFPTGRGERTVGIILPEQARTAPPGPRGDQGLRGVTIAQGSDIGMPDMSGYELAERSRREAWSKTTMLIALTGCGQDADRRHALAAGFNHHLIKPVDPEILEGLFKARMEH